jgi:hypothetical protein
MQQHPPTDDRDEMARSDTANGERPEHPRSAEHSAQERRRTGEHPVGEDQAATNRAEEPPV